ncbi:hypothetical protein HOLleu_38341 [Holothuria leucospilota]|uniref:Uncharacterized protein n=1 Tax=Holothuria leucospilota TaxID=206669 RepID=A0A9Q0YGW0_HOLLE|nr:hypothetical protein HOLleu_38341 [Holothuria leucospilota]
MPDSAKTDYQKVCNLFQVRFGSHGQKDLYRARLRIRKRKQGEPLVELAADIRRLINAAYPDMPPEVKNELGSDYFIEALDNAVQRTVVRRRKPTSLEAALKVAMEEEAIMQLEASRKGPNLVASTGETSHMQQMLNDLATQVSQLNDNVQQLMQNKVEVQGSHPECNSSSKVPSKTDRIFRNSIALWTFDELNEERSARQANTLLDYFEIKVTYYKMSTLPTKLQSSWLNFTH